MIEKPTIVNHPLVQDKLSRLRCKDTPAAEFRRLLRETAHLLGYEVLRDPPLVGVEIDTPLARIERPMVDPERLVLVSILRAGEALLLGMLDLVPEARAGHIGLRRDPVSLRPGEYYFNVPDNLGESLVVVVDPMLATGHSAVAAVRRLKEVGARELRMMCVVAAPEGVATFQAAHPDVPLFVAAVDERLNAQGDIVPGMGDAGDRMYRTV